MSEESPEYNAKKSDEADVPQGKHDTVHDQMIAAIKAVLDDLLKAPSRANFHYLLMTQGPPVHLNGESTRHTVASGTALKRAGDLVIPIFQKIGPQSLYSVLVRHDPEFMQNVERAMENEIAWRKAQEKMGDMEGKKFEPEAGE